MLYKNKTSGALCQALQWTGDPLALPELYMVTECVAPVRIEGFYLKLVTPLGNMNIAPGDWLLFDEKSSWRMMRQELFEALWVRETPTFGEQTRMDVVDSLPGAEAVGG